MKRNSMPAFFVALLFAFCRSASADPITTGSMIYSAPVPTSLTISTSGDRFTFNGGFALGDNNSFFPNERCRIGLCNPGQSLNFGGNFVAPDVGGTLTLDGRTFPINGTTVNNGRASLHVIWSATLVAPFDLPLGLVTLTAPFSLTGAFTWFDVFANDPTNPHLDFSGSGTLTAIFDHRNFEFPGQNQLFLKSATYAFAEPTPTPEPGTVLLLATGLVGVVRARRRRLLSIGLPTRP